MMEYACGNIYIRENRLDKAGRKTQGHKHNFDHTTYCVRGRIRVLAFRRTVTIENFTHEDGKPAGSKRTETLTVLADTELEAGRWCLIRADVEHEIAALEDDTLYHCIFSHRDPQGEVVQEANGWMSSYS